METSFEQIVEKVARTLVEAGSVFREDKKKAYRKAIADEVNLQAKWVLETILENAEAAERLKSPLCDDTGIPHIVLDVGDGAVVTGELLDAVAPGLCLCLALIRLSSLFNTTCRARIVITNTAFQHLGNILRRLAQAGFPVLYGAERDIVPCGELALRISQTGSHLADIHKRHLLSNK